MNENRSLTQYVDRDWANLKVSMTIDLCSAFVGAVVPQVQVPDAQPFIFELVFEVILTKKETRNKQMFSLIQI